MGKTTHNRNEKNAINGIRVAILFSASDVVICKLRIMMAKQVQRYRHCGALNHIHVSMKYMIFVS